MSTSNNLIVNRYRKICIVAIFIWITIIIPLYYEDSYFNMLQAKAHVYLIGFAGGTILSLAGVVLAKKNDSLSFGKLSKLDICVICGGITAVLSSLLSSDPLKSLTGLDGWGVGGFAMMLFSCIYLILSRDFIIKQNIWKPVMLANSIIFIIGILNSAGIDPLQMHAGMRRDQIYWYISTLGNLNWIVGYLCIIIPLFAVFYIESEKNYSKKIYLPFLFLAFMNLVLTASDGVYMALGLCSFFAIPYVMKNKERISKTGILFALYGLALMAVQLLPWFRLKRTTYSGIAGFVIDRPIIGIALFVLGIVLYLTFSRWIQSVDNKTLKIGCYVLECALAIIAMIFIVKAISSWNDSWGTDRGKIWSHSIVLFNDLDIKSKIIGVGPEMLRQYYQGLSSYFPIATLSSHSVPIQLLLTNGLLGLICWVGIWLSIIVKYFKDRQWNKSIMAYVLPLIAYLGQSLIYSDQATNYALFCVVLALYSFSISEMEE